MDDFHQPLLDAAFRFISFRPRSEKEIRDFLAKKVHGKTIENSKRIEKVLERLRELEYLDDTKFIRWWVEQRSTFRPKGRRLLEQELQRKGIDKSLIAESLNALAATSPTGGKNGVMSEMDLAKKAIERKLRLWQKLPRLAFKQKVYGFLSRRGFTGDTVRRIIDEVVRGEVQS